MDNMNRIAADSITTPNAAKAMAAQLASAAFNDEIRAILALELLRRVVPSSDVAIANALVAAQSHATTLVSFYDRQYRD